MPSLEVQAVIDRSGAMKEYGYSYTFLIGLDQV